MVGNKLSLTLPGGLTWKTGGLKYLGVFMGDESFELRRCCRCCGEGGGETEKVEVAPAELVLQREDAGHQQPGVLLSVAQAGLHRPPPLT